MAEKFNNDKQDSTGGKYLQSILQKIIICVVKYNLCKICIQQNHSLHSAGELVTSKGV